MADRNAAVVRPVWIKQAEEAKLKTEAEKAAAAKAAFEATFKDVDKNKQPNPGSSSDSEDEDMASKPIGPLDPAKCTAAGAGIAGGSACAPATFIVTAKDSDGRKIPTGGAEVKVKVTPAVGVGGSDIDGIVKDQGDGTYAVTYVVPKRGNYMVTVECNGKPIMGNPFPVFFSAGNATGGLLGLSPTPTFSNLVNQNMPNMPNYSGSVSGAFPGLLGMIPGLAPGASGGVILPGVGASLGEVCQEYLNGRCFKADCNFSHPAHNLLMTAIASTTTMGTLSQAPMAPSAAAMAAAQAIMAAQALQAHAAQVQAQAHSSKYSSDVSEKSGKGDVLKKTVQVSNLSPLLSVEQLKQLFGFCGTVVDCTITESKHFAYIEYSKPEEAAAALALNNMDVSGRPLNVEMAKSLPQKPSTPLSSSSLPIMMQQAVAMQQMQFQQALLMQQTMNSQQAASRAATLKSATELASVRAAEITKKLKAEGFGNDEKDAEKDAEKESRSPSIPLAMSRSKSRSRSPLSHHRRRRSRSFSPVLHRSGARRSKSPRRFRRRSRSFSPLARHSRDHRSRSPVRSHRSSRFDYERRRDGIDRSRRRDSNGSRDYHISISRRNRSRSVSPRGRKSYRGDSESPKRHHHNSSKRHARSPVHRRVSKSPPENDAENRAIYRRRSRSKSAEDKHVESKSRRHRRSRSKSKSVEDKHDESKSRHRRRSRSKSLEYKHKSSDKKEENKAKGKHRDSRRSRSVSSERKHHRSSRLSPQVSGESNIKRNRRSRSRSLDGKSQLEMGEGDDKSDGLKRGERRQSRTVEGKDRGVTSSHRKDESKSKSRKRSRSKSVEVWHESDGEGGKSSLARKKHYDRRRSRSVSAEREPCRASRTNEDKKKDKRRRRSRSRSLEDKEWSKGGGDNGKKDRSDLDASVLDKTDAAAEDTEKRIRSSVYAGDSQISLNVSPELSHSNVGKGKSGTDDSKQTKSTVDMNETDASEGVTKNKKSSSVSNSENLSAEDSVRNEIRRLRKIREGLEDVDTESADMNRFAGASLILDEVHDD